jgi:hypothetical protein
MRFEGNRLRGDKRYFAFPTVRVLPELTVSFERNPGLDVYIVTGWLFWSWELSFCFCKDIR